MLALRALPGLSIETSTSKVVTLSRSTPIGEICVTLPSKVRSLKVSTLMRAGCPSLTRPTSASSTLPRTKTRSMSPTVITSEAAEPMFRIDDTGLPTSTSRVSTMPRSGDRMVALRSSSSARSTAARDWATLASASATLAWATTSWLLALRWRFWATSRAACASSSPDCAIRRSALSALARSKARRANWTSGPSASTMFLSSAASAPRRPAVAAWRLARASRRRAASVSLSSSTST